MIRKNTPKLHVIPQIIMKVIVGFILLMLVVAAVSMLEGCVPGAKPPKFDVPTTPTLQDKLLSQADRETIVRTVKSTDYLMTAFIVFTVLGVIAGLHGIKSGWIASLACIVGAGMKAAFSVPSVYLLSGAVFVGVITIVLVVIAIKSMRVKALSTEKYKDALKDVVGVVQSFKNRIKVSSTGLHANLMTYLAGEKQSTTEVVKEVKEELLKKESDRPSVLVSPTLPENYM